MLDDVSKSQCLLQALLQSEDIFRLSYTHLNRYRAGYSYKDPGQARILAIKMKHEHFQHLLSQAAVTEGQKGGLTVEERAKGVRVQWDPERSPRIGMLDYRSIQIGISGKVSNTWANEWVVGIEDVTEKARELERVVDEDNDIGVDELVKRGLMPVEREYEISEELRMLLQMDER